MGISNEEVRKVIFGMAPWKAPKVDGFHARFYETQWDIIGASICDIMR